MFVRRGGQLYYYRYQKINGRSRRIYAGCGAAAERAAAEDARRAADRATAKAALSATRSQWEALATALDQFHKGVGLLLRFQLTAAGCHQHARGEWRKRSTPGPQQRPSDGNVPTAAGAARSS